VTKRACDGGGRIRLVTAAELPEILLADAAAWRAWLLANHTTTAGVWLVLAKVGSTEPTSLRYEAALEEALCFGWIDGQVGRRDERTYRQRFTPRRPRSIWSASNVSRVQRLTGSGRMHAAGLEQVARAKADGRWEAAYAGQATASVPPDLQAALEGSPAARAAFGRLSAQNRYAVIFRVNGARRPETRARRIESLVAMIARGETPHPQRRPTPGEPPTSG
jgi:uncharacterized protein YdeI (YjbR/CyaY-like superfamily)